MAFAQEALVEEARRARILIRARRAYLQALSGGWKGGAAFEAAVGVLMKAEPEMSEDEAHLTVTAIFEDF